MTLDGLDLQVVTKLEDAQFLLVHGTEAIATSDGQVRGASLEELRTVVVKCATTLKLPMIVANPDLVTVDGDALRTMPGTLGNWYREHGGEVVLMGKPSHLMYSTAAAMLQLGSDEIVCIGDSLEHDIAGAASAGLQSVFVMGGIHKEELKLSADGACWDGGSLQELCHSHGCAPQYVMPYFRA